MVGPMFMERIRITSGSPYRDLIEDFALGDPFSCPKCGCRHHTTYKSVMNETGDREIISGDLHVRTFLVTVCMNCGTERPLIFDLTREV